MKVVLFFIISIISLPTFAQDVFQKLKDTPASQYELGLFKLETGAFILSQKLEGTKIKRSSFKFKKLSFEEEKSHLFMKFSAIGKTKKISEKKCQMFKAAYSSSFPKDKFIIGAWPGLNEQEYKEIASNIGFKFELISKENSNFTITC